MYSRTVDERVLTFGVSGKLTRNTLVMYDRETGSLWPQVLGKAVEGSLTGQTLEFLPAIHTTWAEWRAEHPDTLALVKGYTGNQDRYFSYYTSNSAGVIAETRVDDRLYTKEFVIGAIVDDVQVAYPYSVLNDQPVVNDTISDRAVVVIFSPDSGAGAIYERVLAGKTYTFQSIGGGKMVDEQTNSTWDGTTGKAVQGELAGQQLTAFKSTRIFWFAWKDWYPDTLIYGLD